MGLGYYAHDLWGYLNILATKKLLATVDYSGLFFNTMERTGRNTRFESQWVRRAEGRTFQVVATDKTISLDVLEAKATKGWPVKYPNDKAFIPLNDTGLKRFLRSAEGEFGANFVLNMALAIPEMAAPWQNPYFNTEQRVTQNVISTGSVLVGTILAIKVGAATAPLGGPVSFVIVTGTGVVFVVAWNAVIPPVVSGIAKSFGLTDPYHRERRLQPLP
jgi:hypothetical protein